MEPGGRGGKETVRGGEDVRVRRGSWNARVRGPRAPPAQRRLAGGARRGKPLANLLPLSRVDFESGPQRPRGRTNSPGGGAACPSKAVLTPPGAAGAQRPGRRGRGVLRGSSTPAASSRPDGWIALPWET